MTDLAMSGSSPAAAAMDDAMMEDNAYDGTTTADIDMAEAGEEETYDMGDEKMEGEEDLATEGAVTDWTTGVEEDAPMMEEDAEGGTGFRSPPAVQTWDQGHEVQAMGHAADDADDVGPADPVTQTEQASPPYEGQPATAASSDAKPSSPQPNTTAHTSRHQESQHDPGEKTLVSQDQDRDEDGQTQNQTIEQQDKEGEKEVSVESQQRQDGEGSGDGDEQRANIEIVQREHKDRSPSLEVTIDQDNEADPNGDRLIKQINEVNVHHYDGDAQVERPQLDKDSLEGITLEGVSGETDKIDFDSTSKLSMTADFRGQVFHLCRPYLRRQRAYQNPDYHPYSDKPASVLFTAEEEADIYYKPLVHFFRKMHDCFFDIDGQQQELVLRFDVLTLEINEDSVYAQQVSLYDIDRLYGGSQIPGSLHLQITEKLRFSHRFNALAEHVAGLNCGDTDSATLTADAHHDEGADTFSDLGDESVNEAGAIDLQQTFADADDDELDPYDDAEALEMAPARDGGEVDEGEVEETHSDYVGLATETKGDVLDAQVVETLPLAGELTVDDELYTGNENSAPDAIDATIEAEAETAQSQQLNGAVDDDEATAADDDAKEVETVVGDDSTKVNVNGMSKVNGVENEGGGDTPAAPASPKRTREAASDEPGEEQQTKRARAA